MTWRYDNGMKCPKCDGKVTVIIEKDIADGNAVVRYLIKCSSCGYRRTLQELIISKSDAGIRVRITPKEYTQQRITRGM